MRTDLLTIAPPYRVDQRLLVHRIVDSLTHPYIRQRLVLQIHRHQLKTIGRRGDYIELRVIFKGSHLIAADRDNVQFSITQRCNLRRCIRHHLEVDRIQIDRVIIVRIVCKRQGLLRHPLLQTIRAGAYRLIFQRICGLDIHNGGPWIGKIGECCHI